MSRFMTTMLTLGLAAGAVPFGVANAQGPSDSEDEPGYYETFGYYDDYEAGYLGDGFYDDDWYFDYYEYDDGPYDELGYDSNTDMYSWEENGLF